MVAVDVVRVVEAGWVVGGSFLFVVLEAVVAVRGVG